MGGDALEVWKTIMLAQAQQCFFEKAASDQLKPGVVARLAAQVAAFYARASTELRAYASLKGRPQADKTWAQLLEWNEKAFGAWAQVHAAAERDISPNLPYTSPAPPLHLPCAGAGARRRRARGGLRVRRAGEMQGDIGRYSEI